MGRNAIRIEGPNDTDNGLALTASRQVTVRPARLFEVTFFNTGPDQYFQIFDLAAAPVGGTVPKLQVKILADQHGSITFPAGKLFKKGIFVGNSTSSATYTAGAANCLIDTDFWNFTSY